MSNGPDFPRAQLAAPASWWARTTDASLAPVSSPLPARAEVAIVGAGLSGAAAAWELRAAGVDPAGIVVLDAAGPAFGASGRNGGFLLSFPGVELLEWIRRRGEQVAAGLVRLNIENRQLAAAFFDEHGLWSQRGGSWSLAVDDAESAGLARCHAFLESVAPGAFSLHAKAPAPVEGFAAGLFQPSDRGIHPADYTAALLRASGATFTGDCLVGRDGLRLDASGATLRTSRGELRAERVVLATNAWLPAFFPALDPARLQPVRNHVLVAQPRGDAPGWGEAVWYADHGYLYFRQLPGGRFLLGGARNADPAPEDTDAPGPNPRIAAHLREVVLPRLLAGARHDVLCEWTGTMAFTPDGLPVAGQAPGAGGRVFVLAGFTGYGLGFHRVAARSLAAAILGGGGADCPFDPARFSPR